MNYRYRGSNEMKDSGVEWLGDIPKEWEKTTLKRIYNQIIDYRGKTPKKVESGIQLITAKNIKNGKIDYEISKEYVEQDKFDEIMQRGKVKTNDLLFTTEAPLGELALVDKEGFALAQRIILFRFKNQEISKFSKYLIGSKGYKDYLYSNSTGSTALGIKGSKIPGLIFIEPDNFKKINLFLDKKTAEFDTIIEKKQAFIEKLKEAKKSLISEVVTGKKKLTTPPSLPLSKGEEQSQKWTMRDRTADEMKDSGVEWLGMIPREWEVSKLKNCFDFFRGLPITKSDLSDEGIQCINYGEVHSKYPFIVNTENNKLKKVSIEFLKTHPNSLLNYGDLVFADTSEDLKGSGNFTFIDGTAKIFAGYHTITIRSREENDLKYFAYLFESDNIRKQIQLKVKGVKVYSITQGILKEISILKSQEQQLIVDFLDEKTIKIDSTIDKIKLQIEKLKEAKQSLISEAVTGKIEVL